MTSENVQYPMGTIVRETHAEDANGHTTWVLVQDHATVGNEIVETYLTWVVLFSTCVDNLGQTLGYDELPSEHIEKIGVVPGTPAEQEEQVNLEKVIKGDYPRLTMGTKPDGSPWVVHADFGSGVAINSTGDIWDNKRVITPAQADRKATALKDAMVWAINDLVSAVEDNKAYFAEQAKQQPRIGVDRVGYLVAWKPRADRTIDRLPWVCTDVFTSSGGEIRTDSKRVTELTQLETITVGTDFEEVADFFDGAGFEADPQPTKLGTRLSLFTKDGKVDVYPGTRVWRDEHRFYAIFEGSKLFVTVCRGV